jgi:hypothetical protein
MSIKKVVMAIGFLMILTLQGWSNDESYHFTSTGVVVKVDGGPTHTFLFTESITEYIVAAIATYTYEFNSTPLIDVSIFDDGGGNYGLTFFNTGTNYSFDLWDDASGIHFTVNDQGGVPLKTLDLAQPQQKLVFDYLSGVMMKWVINSNDYSFTDFGIRNHKGTNDLEIWVRGDMTFWFQDKGVEITGSTGGKHFSSYMEPITEYVMGAIAALPHQKDATPDFGVDAVSMEGNYGLEFKNKTTSFSFRLWDDANGSIHMTVFNRAGRPGKKITLEKGRDKKVFENHLGAIIKWVIDLNDNTLGNSEIRNYSGTDDLELFIK